jgi:RIO-like serine/threonine protein kinase
MECKKHFQIIGNGSESIVVAGPDIGEVTKIYTGHSKDAALAAARSEFEILLSLSKVRSSGVRTPKPYKIIQSDHVGLVMEKCEGTKFPEFMLTHGCTHQIIQLIAGRLFKFIKEYVDLNNRPLSGL